MTRRGYHCRGQPGSAHGKPAVIGRQKPAVAPGQFAARKRYRRNVSLNSRNLSFELASLRWRVRIPEAETGRRFVKSVHGKAGPDMIYYEL